jgi:hypothetical protein
MNGDFFLVHQFKAPSERKIIAQGNPAVAGAALGSGQQKVQSPERAIHEFAKSFSVQEITANKFGEVEPRYFSHEVNAAVHQHHSHMFERLLPCFN